MPTHSVIGSIYVKCARRAPAASRTAARGAGLPAAQLTHLVDKETRQEFTFIDHIYTCPYGRQVQFRRPHNSSGKGY